MRSSTPSSNGPVVVEFIGTPGSGKTTLSSYLVGDLTGRGIRATTPIERSRTAIGSALPARVVNTIAPVAARPRLLWALFYASGLLRGLAWFRRNPELARAIVAQQQRRPIPGRLRSHVLYWFFTLAGRTQVLQLGMDEDEVLILDDGFAHRAVALHASHLDAPQASQVDRYIDRFPGPDVLVHVQTDRALCLERIKARGVWPHMADLSASALEQYVANAEAAVEFAVQRARRQGWIVLEVSGTAEPSSTAGLISDAVADRVPSMPAPIGGVGRIPRIPRRSRLTNTLAARLDDSVIDDDTLMTVLEGFELSPRSSARNVRLNRRNRNVLVETDRGRKLVKVYRPQWTPDTVECAHSILRQLELLEFPAPRLNRLRDGRDQISTADGIATVFDYVPGNNLSLYYLLRPDRLRLTAESARTLARFHLRLRHFVPGGEHHLGFADADSPPRRDAVWFAETLHNLVDRSKTLQDGKAADLAATLVRSADALSADIEQIQGKLLSHRLPRLVIHGDFGLHNLIFSASRAAVPVDFELARLDWRVNDLISALGKYRFRSGEYDMEAMAVFLRAYRAEFPLSEDEEGLFVDAWHLYKLQSAVQYWLSYFLTDGPARKLESAIDSLDQAARIGENADPIDALMSDPGP